MSGEKLGRQEAGQEQVRSAKQGQGSVPGTGRGMFRTWVHSRVKGGVTAGRAEDTWVLLLLGSSRDGVCRCTDECSSRSAGSAAGRAVIALRQDGEGLQARYGGERARGW